MKNRKILWWLLLSLVFACMAATTTSMAKEIQGAESSQKETKIRLYLGQSFILTDVPEGEFVMDQSGIITISHENKIKTLAIGTVVLSVKKEENVIPVASIQVVGNELFNTLVFDAGAFPARIVGSDPAPLNIPEFQGLQCRWSTETPELVTVTEDGMISPLRSGVARIVVELLDNYGGEYRFVFSITILSPHFAFSQVNVAKACSTTLMLQDISGHPVVYKVMDGSILSIISSSPSQVVVKAKKVGKTKLIASVDGLEIQCVINVTNPKLKKGYGFYQKKKKIGLKLSGINGKSVAVWSSSNEKVAKVNTRGLVSTLKYGSAEIRCRVDGKTLRYYLAVSTKTAVKAMRYGYKQLGKKKYSQARRMDKNFYDCSSFVYRCYRAAGKYLVYRTSWAPVAADIGKYYVRKGKKIKASGAYKESQLRPGDLICFGGSKARRNGRYKRIYHIAMYIGNSRTMESSSTYNNVVIRKRDTLKKKYIPVVVRP